MQDLSNTVCSRISALPDYIWFILGVTLLLFGLSFFLQLLAEFLDFKKYDINQYKKKHNTIENKSQTLLADILDFLEKRKKYKRKKSQTLKDSPKKTK